LGIGERQSAEDLELGELDVGLIGGFLEHLERDRHVGVRTRNLRLTAIHSLLTYASYRCPEHAETIRRVLAIPSKTPDRTVVTYLTRPETTALLGAVDRSTPLGERDYVLILVGIETGLRVSELTALRWADVTFGCGAHLHTLGKGRRERTTPLKAPTARLLKSWQRERRADPDDPVFATRGGASLSSDAVERLLAKHVALAGANCPSLPAKVVTPHTLRHTCAMNLLGKRTDIATIALYLGHSSTKSTERYLHADLELKEQALARTAPTPTARRRYRPPDKLLEFLEGL
jgi:integrase/recombinase XerD